jgi:tetratricopeptide (TPR) repeat protein
MRSARHTRLRLFLVLLGLLLALPALAQPSGRPPEELLARFQEAERLYRAGEYAQALSGYKEVYLLTGKPSLIFNMAQCHRLLGNDAEALRGYQQFLFEVPDTPYRAEIEGRIQELEARLAEAEAAKTAVTAPAPPTPREGSQLPGGILLGIGAAAAGGGIAVGLLAFSAAFDARELSRVGEGEAPDLEALELQVARAHRLGLVADALAVAGLATGGTGLILRSRARATAQLSLSPQGLALRLTY